MMKSWDSPLSHSSRPVKMLIDSYQLEKYQQAAQSTNKRIEVIAQPGDEWSVIGGGSYVLPDNNIGIMIHGKGELSEFWKIVGS